MSEHTATPWRTENWTCHAPRTVLVDDQSAITGKRIVAECETDEDAAFIVTACNAHARLTAEIAALVAENEALHEKLARKDEACNNTINAALMMPCHCAGPETGVRCVPGCDAALSMPGGLTDYEIMQKWDQHRQQGEKDGAPFLRVIVKFARSWMARPTAAGAGDHCREGDRCVCGGDLPRVREGCGNWMKGGQS
jgi:hypothetical protein